MSGTTDTLLLGRRLGGDGVYCNLLDSSGALGLVLSDVLYTFERGGRFSQWGDAGLGMVADEAILAQTSDSFCQES
jgi:hypothetical protein